MIIITFNQPLSLLSEIVGGNGIGEMTTNPRQLCIYLTFVNKENA